MSGEVVAPASRNALCPCGSGKRYKHCHGVIAPITADVASAPVADIHAIMAAALAAQQANRFDEAATLYDKALAIDPSQPDALHMRGIVAFSQGALEEAMQWIDRATVAGLDSAGIRHNRVLIEQATEEARADKAKVPHFIAAVEQAAAIGRAKDDEHIGEDEVRVLAYYLPQFHRISENDDWWGIGFTEWTNVRRAMPNFPGHQQPRKPGELGYYDLLDPVARNRQAELAREHGINGFCYYYYWFNGRRLLEQPLDAVLKSGDPDFPFCVFWANEDWIRSWDGGNREVLVKQEHSPQDDRNFITSLLPVFADKRYIRVRGQPLLMVYRCDNLPESNCTFDLWRQICLEAGEMPPYIVTADTGSVKPLVSGADASVEFPPHRMSKVTRAERPDGMRADWDGILYDQRAVAAYQSTRQEADHTHYRTVMPMWDNTARRQLDGTTFLNARPDVFRAWLRETMLRARDRLPPGQRLVFVNAWNEWAEGAYLEPDEANGRAFLEAARDARYVPKSLPRFGDRIAALIAQAAGD